MCMHDRFMKTVFILLFSFMLNAQAGKSVTDPALKNRLNGKEHVIDPELLKQLNENIEMHQLREAATESAQKLSLCYGSLSGMAEAYEKQGMIDEAEPIDILANSAMVAAAYVYMQADTRPRPMRDYMDLVESNAYSAKTGMKAAIANGDKKTQQAAMDRCEEVKPLRESIIKKIQRGSTLPE